MNKRDRMKEQILHHGFNLQRIFSVPNVGPVELAKKVHRIEVKAHRMAEDYCNGLYETEEYFEKKEKSIEAALDRLLGYKGKDIPVFINSDPRGYALKIKDDWVREHREDFPIHTDWGGYGILAPDFDGN